MLSLNSDLDPDSEGFSSDDSRILTILSVFSSCFSFLGSSFIIFCYWKFIDLRSFAFRLVFLISISDLFNSTANILGDAGHNTGLCYFQSLMISYFELASMLWSVSIAFTLHMAFLRENAIHHEAIETYMSKYHAVCWGLPAILTILPLTTGSYGDAGGWCWIKSQRDIDVAWRFIQFYIPLWLSIIYSLVVYVKVHLRLKHVHSLQPAIPSEAMSSTVDELKVAPSSDDDLLADIPLDVDVDGDGNGDEEDADNDEVNAMASEDPASERAQHQSESMITRMKYYPLVLVVCYAWASVNRIYQIFEEPVLWLSGLHVFFASMQGAFDALVFGLTPSVLKRIQSYRLELCSRRHGGGGGGGDGREAHHHHQRYASEDIDLDAIGPPSHLHRAAPSHSHRLRSSSSFSDEKQLPSSRSSASGSSSAAASASISASASSPPNHNHHSQPQARSPGLYPNSSSSISSNPNHSSSSSGHGHRRSSSAARVKVEEIADSQLDL